MALCIDDSLLVPGFLVPYVVFSFPPGMGGAGEKGGGRHRDQHRHVSGVLGRATAPMPGPFVSSQSSVASPRFLRASGQEVQAAGRAGEIQAASVIWGGPSGRETWGGASNLTAQARQL